MPQRSPALDELVADLVDGADQRVRGLGGLLRREAEGRGHLLDDARTVVGDHRQVDADLQLESSKRSPAASRIQPSLRSVASGTPSGKARSSMTPAARFTLIPTTSAFAAGQPQQLLAAAADHDRRAARPVGFGSPSSPVIR